MDIKCFKMGSFGANCYLVKVDNAAIVIDPFDVDRRIEDFFNDNKEKPKYILLTHCHFDHILGADKLREKYNAQIVIGEYDAEGLLDTSISLSTWAGHKQEPFSADMLVKDGEKIKFGSDEIEVIHTPGHTAGSVCYKIEDVIFTGDTLFKSNIGRTDVPTGNYSAIIESINKLKSLSLKDIIIYPGHGGSTTMKKEIENNPYM